MDIKIKNVNLVIDKTEILSNINLDIDKPSIYGLVGRNGAGKTSLLKAIVGLYEISSGEIFINGLDLNTSRNTILKNLGSVIEYPVFYENLTAEENMEIHYKYMMYNQSCDYSKYITFLGLKLNTNKKVEEFSLGMKQRLGIARALSTEPDILLLDEPFNGLDPIGLAELSDKLIELKQDKIILISSHSLDELIKISDRIGIVANNTLQELDANSVNVEEKAIKIMKGDL